MATTTAIAPVIVVMGASGSGKTTVGGLLGARLAVPFLDADTVHPAANIRKMAAGASLDDADRAPWLAQLATWLAAQRPTGAVLACSALRRSYREVLRAAAPDALFVHLRCDSPVLVSRLAARADHFMPPALVASQLRTLEPLEVDEFGLDADCSLPPEKIIASIVEVLGGSRERS